MDPILSDFETDLVRVEKLVALLELVRAFPSSSAPTDLSPDDFINKSIEIHFHANQVHADLVVAMGTLVLYLGGRFESFVRTAFEDLCQRIASKKTSFDQLPRDMRNNILKLTAEVVANPRKYGHGEKGAESFMKVLALNFSNTTKIEGTNAQCLSITHENMNEETFKELFERIGIKDIWAKIGNQADVMAFFETAEPSEARTKSTTYLNTFMQLRNKIAHPSGTVTFPESSKVRQHIRFFRLMAQTISSLIPVLEIQVHNKQN